MSLVSGLHRISFNHISLCVVKHFKLNSSVNKFHSRIARLIWLKFSHLNFEHGKNESETKISKTHQWSFAAADSWIINGIFDSFWISWSDFVEYFWEIISCCNGLYYSFEGGSAPRKSLFSSLQTAKKSQKTRNEHAITKKGSLKQKCSSMPTEQQHVFVCTNMSVLCNLGRRIGSMN